jgi:hypothetical protein
LKDEGSSHQPATHHIALHSDHQNVPSLTFRISLLYAPTRRVWIPPSCVPRPPVPSPEQHGPRRLYLEVPIWFFSAMFMRKRKKGMREFMNFFVFLANDWGDVPGCFVLDKDFLPFCNLSLQFEKGPRADACGLRLVGWRHAHVEFVGSVRGRDQVQ